MTKKRKSLFRCFFRAWGKNFKSKSTYFKINICFYSLWMLYLIFFVISLLPSPFSIILVFLHLTFLLMFFFLSPLPMARHSSFLLHPSIPVSPQSRRQQDPSPGSNMANADMEQKMRWRWKKEEKNGNWGSLFNFNTISLKGEAPDISRFFKTISLVIDIFFTIFILDKRKQFNWNVKKNLSVWNIKYTKVWMNWNPEKKNS